MFVIFQFLNRSVSSFATFTSQFSFVVHIRLLTTNNRCFILKKSFVILSNSLFLIENLHLRRALLLLLITC
ncbi:unnamed protein product [Arabidopsis halleri]